MLPPTFTDFALKLNNRRNINKNSNLFLHLIWERTQISQNTDKSDMVFLLPQVAFLLKPQLNWMHFLLKEAIKTHYRGVFFKYHHAIWPSRNHLEVCPNSIRYLQENPMQWDFQNFMGDETEKFHE